MKTREDYINLINNTQVFIYDEKLDFSAYKSQLNELVTNVWQYLELYGNPEYLEYAVEVMSVIKRCVNRFDISKKDRFFIYLDCSLKKTLKQVINKMKYDNKQKGLKISRTKKELISNILRYAEQRGKDLSSVKDRKFISEVFAIHIKELEEVLRILPNVNRDNMVISDDGEYVELISLKPDSNPNALENACYKESFHQKLKYIEECYLSKQKRTQKVLKPLLSNEIAIKLANIENWQQIAAKYDFIDEKFVYDINKKGGKAPQKLLAEKLGKSVESISRTYNDFLRKIKEKQYWRET